MHLKQAKEKAEADGCYTATQEHSAKFLVLKVTSCATLAKQLQNRNIPCDYSPSRLIFLSLTEVLWEEKCGGLGVGLSFAPGI